MLDDVTETGVDLREESVEVTQELRVVHWLASEPPVSIDDWNAQLVELQEACLTAVAAAGRAVLAGKPGRIVFVVHPSTVRAIGGASISGIMGAFVNTFAQVGAIELTGRDVTCNVVVAGWTETSAPADVRSAIPAGRWVTDIELAHAVAHFASADAGCTSGATLTVDGGFVITKAPGGSPLLS